MYELYTIVGRVGRDAEMRYTPTGQAVCSFSVAVSEEYTKDGQKIKKTKWIRVTSWGKQAEVHNQYVKKGMLVLVAGKLNGDENGNPKIFKKQDGSASASFEMTANTVQFLSRVEGQEAAPAQESEFPF
jgi:single-strand DNA-binding protein